MEEYVRAGAIPMWAWECSAVQEEAGPAKLVRQGTAAAVRALLPAWHSCMLPVNAQADDDEALRGEGSEALGTHNIVINRVPLANAQADDEEALADEGTERWRGGSVCMIIIALPSVEQRCHNYKHPVHAQGDDEEALADEGAEALRLQRAAAEALRPEDFGLPDGAEEGGTTDDEDGEATTEAAPETLGQAAARVCLCLDALAPGRLDFPFCQTPCLPTVRLAV